MRQRTKDRKDAMKTIAEADAEVVPRKDIVIDQLITCVKM
jgi:hypothetical protein